MLPSDEASDIDAIVTPTDTAYLMSCLNFCKRVSQQSESLEKYYDELRMGLLLLEHALLMTTAVSNMSRINKITLVAEILTYKPFYTYFTTMHDIKLQFTSLFKLGKILTSDIWGTNGGESAVAGGLCASIDTTPCNDKSASVSETTTGDTRRRKRRRTHVPRMPDIIPSPSATMVLECAYSLIENKKLSAWREAGGVILDFMEKQHAEHIHKEVIVCGPDFPKYYKIVPVLIGMCNNMTFKETFDERITTELRTLPAANAWKTRLLSKNETMYRLLQNILDSDPMTSNKVITSVIESPFTKAPAKMFQSHTMATFIKLCVVLIEKTSRAARATSNIMETDYYTHVINPQVRLHRERKQVEEMRLPTLYFDFRTSMYGYVYKGVFHHHRHPVICISAWLASCMTIRSVPDTLKDLHELISAKIIDEKSALSENQYFTYLQTHDKATRV